MGLHPHHLPPVKVFILSTPSSPTPGFYHIHTILPHWRSSTYLKPFHSKGLHPFYSILLTPGFHHILTIIPIQRYLSYPHHPPYDVHNHPTPKFFPHQPPLLKVLILPIPSSPATMTRRLED